MFKITFKFENSEDVVAHAMEGEKLLDVARRVNVAIDAPCSGNTSCGKCKVQLLSGELDSKKTHHITDAEYDAGWRLACASKILGDVEIGIPDIASAYKSRMKVADLSSPEEIAIFEKIKSDVVAAGINLVNDMEIAEITMEVPTLDDTMPDNERLSWAIEAQAGVEKVTLPYYIIRKLPDVIRESKFNVKVAYKKTAHGAYVYDIVDAKEELKLIGLAVDIGTTTVSAVLVDLKSGEILAKASSGNGQIRFGADVINRIVEQSKPGGVERLQKAIIEETINPMIHNMCKTINIPSERIYRMCMASNSTMNHLFAGVNADPLRMEPYIPTFFKLDHIAASELKVEINPNASIIFAPNIGSYVGGDITAGTLSSLVWNSEEYSVFIDLGTNGEIVFGNSDFLMSCACSAGPAFEGGDISCGMRATDGAIEAVKIDEETMEPTLSIIGDEGQKPVGLCGSGIIDAIAELYRCGIINAKGQFVRESKRIVIDTYGIKSYVLAFKEDAGSVNDVEINEVDIDSFIRAKGAIFSGINTLVESLGFDMSIVDNVYVAGGIGSGINMGNAVRIGMLPDIPLEKYKYIGNSSLAGAYAMILSKEAEEKVSELASSMTYLELSTHPGYMDSFVAACFIPHTDANLFPSFL